ncbi:MAG: LapA family protein [Microbacteriaceae bacterium]|nr:LapA family protein [Burkholderiaceae bacterium]
MRAILWLFRAFIFFTLFAFALNNEQPVVVHWFFGAQWTAPVVIVVLTAFAGGAAIGVLAMVPSWWHQRRVARRHAPPPPPPARAPSDTATQAPTELGPEHPPREGL